MSAADGRGRVVTAFTSVAVLALAACGSTGRGVPPPASPTGSPRVPEEVAAYIVPWDEERGLGSVAAGAGDVLTSLSPVWYTPTSDGGLKRNDDGPTAPVVDAAAQDGIALVPSISNFVDGRWAGDLVGRLVDDPALRSAHVRAITGTVVQQGWDGIDLDYESLAASDREAYSTFVEELGRSLRAVGAELTVTVQAKTSDRGTSDVQRSQDYAALGRSADQVRVMAYDHAWDGSEAGSVAPLEWVEDVLAFAVSQVPAEKVALGIGAYGYDWVGTSGTAVSWDEALALAREHDAVVRWDDRAASSWFSYTDDDGAEHTVWFESARSAERKLATAAAHGVGGVVVWQLGGADPRLWQVLGPAP